jgi:hypothetical protein
MAPRTWRSWCSGSSCGCWAARPAVPGSPLSTASCWRRPAEPFREIGGHRPSSRPRRCWAGTENWCDASGPTARTAGPAGHPSTPSLLGSCCGWRGRTLAGAASGSPGTSASSASGSVPPRSGPCYHDRASVPHRGAPDPPGRSSCERRPRRSSRGLLHGGDDPAADAVRAVVHRAQHRARRRPRGHGQPQLSVGHPAGQERRDGLGRSGEADQVPAARPRRQVHRFLRRGVLHPRRAGHPNPDRGSEGQRLRRAVGAGRAGGVS